MIIGLHGFKHSGKTTLADELYRRMGFYHMSFAEPLRLFAASIEGLRNAHDLDGVKDRQQQWLRGHSLRDIMREASEHLKATIAPNLWVDRVARQMDRRLSQYPHENIVISDVRFPSEAEMILGRGGAIFKIDRQLDVGDTHVSEKPLPDWMIKATIPNLGTKEQFFNQALHIMREHT